MSIITDIFPYLKILDKNVKEIIRKTYFAVNQRLMIPSKRIFCPIEKSL